MKDHCQDDPTLLSVVDRARLERHVVFSPLLGPKVSGIPWRLVKRALAGQSLTPGEVERIKSALAKGPSK